MAYIELVGFDLDQSRRDTSANILASVIVGVALFFAVLMGCALVIALTWNTPHRIAAICWMGGGFIAIAVIAIVYRSNAMQAQQPFLATVRREWQEDSALFERMTSDEKSE